MQAEIIDLPCKHRQDDGSTVYKAVKIVGLGKEGQDLVLRCPEVCYPGNMAMGKILEELVWRVNGQ